MKPFHEIIKTNKIGGYFERDPDRLKYMLGAVSENYRKMGAFIEAIKYLVKIVMVMILFYVLILTKI